MNKQHKSDQEVSSTGVDYSEHRIKQLQLQLMTLSQDRANDQQRIPILGNLALIYRRLFQIDASIHAWKQTLSFCERENDNHMTTVALMGLANVYGQDVDVDEGLRYAKLAVEKSPTNPEALHILADAYSYVDDDDSAIEWHKQVLSYDPKYIRAYESLGSIYAERGDYDTAMTYYDKVVELEPDSISIYFSRGNMYMAREKYEQALVEYKKLVLLVPDEELVYNNLGNCYLQMKDLDKARRNFKKAIDKRPLEALWPTVGMGIVYRCLAGKRAQAKSIAFFREAAKQYKSGKSRMQSGRLEYETRYAITLLGLDDEETITHWQDILHKNLRYSSLIDCARSVKLLADCQSPPMYAGQVLAILEEAIHRKSAK